jgi:hypothetical protein
MQGVRVHKEDNLPTPAELADHYSVLCCYGFSPDPIAFIEGLMIHAVNIFKGASLAAAHRDLLLQTERARQPQSAAVPRATPGFAARELRLCAHRDPRLTKHRDRLNKKILDDKIGGGRGSLCGLGMNCFLCAPFSVCRVFASASLASTLVVLLLHRSGDLLNST